MNIKLSSIDPFSPPLELAIDKLPAVIGCEERADVHLADRGVSGRHCELFSLNGALMVRDMKSELGILVNGQAVKDAVLKPGDTLTIGIRYFRIAYCADENGRPADATGVQSNGKAKGASKSKKKSRPLVTAAATEPDKSDSI